MKEGISVVIPAYNEEQSIRETIDQLKKVLKSYDHEIIVVEDYSKDNTRKILSSIKGIKKVFHAANKGYGFSLKDGINHAKHETIVITDADGTYPISSIPKLLEYRDHDIVSGKRTGKRAKIPLLRRPAKFMLQLLADFLVGMKIPDLNCGLRVLKRSQVKRYFSILPDRFSFTMTHLLSSIADGASVKFVKIDYYNRKGSSSIHPIKDFLRFLLIIFRSGLLINPMKFFTFISMGFMAFAAIVFFISLFYLDRLLDSTIVILISSAIQIFLFGLLADLVLKKTKNG